MTTVAPSLRLSDPIVATAGQVDFPAGFPAPEPVDGVYGGILIERIRGGDRTTLSVNTHFSLVSVTADNFTARLITPAQAGDVIRVYGNQDLRRSETYQPGQLPSAALEAEVTKLMQILQERGRDLGRTLQAPLGEVGASVPPAVDRRGKVAMFADTEAAELRDWLPVADFDNGVAGAQTAAAEAAASAADAAAALVDVLAALASTIAQVALAVTARTGAETARTGAETAEAGAAAAATTAVTTAINALKGGAPAALDTVYELAAALNNNPAQIADILTALALRLRVDTAAQGLTGPQIANALANLGLSNVAELAPVFKNTLTVAAAALDVAVRADAPSGKLAVFEAVRGGNIAWLVGGDATAMAGANAGSDFILDAYNDAGVFLGRAVSIARATQIASFPKSPLLPHPAFGDSSQKGATTKFVQDAIAAVSAAGALELIDSYYLAGDGADYYPAYGRAKTAGVKVVRFAGKTYPFSAGIVFTAQGDGIAGTGKGSTFLQFAAAVTKMVTVGLSGAAAVDNNVFDLTLVRGAGAIPAGSIGIAGDEFNNFEERGVRVTGCAIGRRMTSLSGSTSITYISHAGTTDNCTEAYLQLIEVAGVKISMHEYGRNGGEANDVSAACLVYEGGVNDVNHDNCSFLPRGPNGTRPDMVLFDTITVGNPGIYNFTACVTENTNSAFTSNAASTEVTALNVLGGRYAQNSELVAFDPATRPLYCNLAPDQNAGNLSLVNPYRCKVGGQHLTLNLVGGAGACCGGHVYVYGTINTTGAWVKLQISGVAEGGQTHVGGAPTGTVNTAGLA
jgi:hypothetical protein